MTSIDWIIVIAVNFAIFAYGIWCSRRTKTSLDWFLGGRSLPFWIVGLSMFATSVDGGEYVSINGQSYKDGLSVIAGLMAGATIGSIVAAFIVVPRLYLGGHFTNAEFLEVRFGTTARIFSVFVQIQYRTSVLATIMVALQIVMVEIAGLDQTSAWIVVIGLALATSVYAAWGGLKTIAFTDVLLSIVMLTGIIVLWSVVWNKSGGFEGFGGIIDKMKGDTGMPYRAGDQIPGGSHPVVVLVGWILVVTGYFVVNHTQTMKLFGVRSLWDLKMAALLGGALISGTFFFSGGLGLFGRNLFPDLPKPDMIYPRMVNELLAPGLKGLVLAGLVSASISTFTGIGAALSALLTKDLYARCLVRDASESHYLKVSRVSTILIVAVSFLYVPFILNSKTMVDFFISITSVFVTPLMTLYLVGVLTSVHRRSGMVGLLAGAGYGLLRLADTFLELSILPWWFTEKFAAFAWSASITALAMLLASLAFGWKNQPEQKARQEKSAEEQKNSSDTKDTTDDSHHLTPILLRPGLWGFFLIFTTFGCIFLFFW